MNSFGGVVLVAITLVMLFHISQIKKDTPDQILAFYLILICVADIYLSHVHDRFLR